MQQIPSTPPPPQQTVKAEFDPATFTLRVSPDEIYLLPGSRILWEFSQLPAGFFPWLRFADAGPRNFGPFASICQVSQGLLAEVPVTAEPGRFAYRLLLRSRTGSRNQEGHATIWSAEQSLTISAALAKTTIPIVAVTASGSQLALSPQTVVLGSAADVLVGFTFAHDILSDAGGLLEPRIEFTDYTPHNNGRTRQSPPLGPFSALIFDGNTLWGTGDAGMRGIFNYRALALRQSTGEVVWASSPDPVIDDQREPPP